MPDRDQGSTSLAVVLTAPLLLVLMFMGFQAAMWSHTRTEARLVAREAAILVARDGVSTSDAVAAAEASLAAQSLLDAPAVEARVDGNTVVVTVGGRAPGIVRFTSAPVRVREAVPLEGWVPL